MSQAFTGPQQLPCNNPTLQGRAQFNPPTAPDNLIMAICATKNLAAKPFLLRTRVMTIGLPGTTWHQYRQCSKG
ncbi:hypothetical protein GE21DRAFT_1289745 [Neurospora crassa]|nr:hypothetical protein GE21DRAFT_1289745 [Neurospora crassa]